MIERYTIITVNYNTSDFIELMLYSFSKLSDFNYKVIIVDNGSSKKDKLRLNKVISNYKNINFIEREQEDEPASLAHATALDLAIEKVDTEYFLVMDSDCVILKKSWDSILLNEMKINNLKIIGTPRAKDGIGDTFPSVFATLFETKTFKSLNVSFKPDYSNISIYDTGWQVKKEYLDKNKMFFTFNFIRSIDYKDYSYYKKLYCGIFLYKDEMIASHFGRGASLGAAKYLRRLPYFGFIKRFIGRIEKQNWLNISYKIINQEN